MAPWGDPKSLSEIWWHFPLLLGAWSIVFWLWPANNNWTQRHSNLLNRILAVVVLLLAVLVWSDAIRRLMRWAFSR